MQRVLEKMAQKLNSYDEASLMQLWQHYAIQANEFEPTKRWEEAALALCLIQAVHWKNQLFNYYLARTANPDERGAFPKAPDFFGSTPAQAPAGEEQPGDAPARRATILAFPGSSKTDNGTPHAEDGPDNGSPPSGKE